MFKAVKAEKNVIKKATLPPILVPVFFSNHFVSCDAVCFQTLKTVGVWRRLVAHLLWDQKNRGINKVSYSNYFDA
jgi:hypothetical protein